MQQNLLPRFEAVFCDHTQMTSCCEDVDCGHYSCPCGIYWDDGSEGDPFWEEEVYDFGPAFDSLCDL